MNSLSMWKAGSSDVDSNSIRQLKESEKMVAFELPPWSFMAPDKKAMSEKVCGELMAEQ